MPDIAPLAPDLLVAMRACLPDVGDRAVEAITHEVPSYRDTWRGPVGQTISRTVEIALDALVTLAGRPRGGARVTPMSPAIGGAYELGRGEARSGRSVDALLAAYRVGARVSWRELSQVAVASGATPQTLAGFAEVVFAYIDELSAASLAGYADEMNSIGREREERLLTLARLLLAGENEDVLRAAATRAHWATPRTLTAVVVPSSQARSALDQLRGHTLQLQVDAAEGERTVFLVPDVRSRSTLVRRLAGRTAVVGPTRPWTAAGSSYARANRAIATAPPPQGQAVDTEHMLAELVLAADPEALADLRRRALAPLDGLSATTRARLTETLRAWLLNHGRRDAIAAELQVHPQTVRYRMGQVRERYGDRLTDPRWILALTVALGLPPGVGPRGAG